MCWLSQLPKGVFQFLFMSYVWCVILWCRWLVRKFHGPRSFPPRNWTGYEWVCVLHLESFSWTSRKNSTSWSDAIRGLIAQVYDFLYSTSASLSWIVCCRWCDHTTLSAKLLQGIQLINLFECFSVWQLWIGYAHRYHGCHECVTREKGRTNGPLCYQSEDKTSSIVSQAESQVGLFC